MGVLAEYLRTEAEQLKAEKVKRRAVVREWVDSLNDLYRQVQEWLTSCDPENLIDRTIEQTPGRELAFGDYQVPVLKMTLVDRSASAARAGAASSSSYVVNTKRSSVAMVLQVVSDNGTPDPTAPVATFFDVRRSTDRRPCPPSRKCT